MICMPFTRWTLDEPQVNHITIENEFLVVTLHWKNFGYILSIPSWNFLQIKPLFKLHMEKFNSPSLLDGLLTSKSLIWIFVAGLR